MIRNEPVVQMLVNQASSAARQTSFALILLVTLDLSLPLVFLDSCFSDPTFLHWLTDAPTISHLPSRDKSIWKIKNWLISNKVSESKKIFSFTWIWSPECKLHVDSSGFIFQGSLSSINCLKIPLIYLEIKSFEYFIKSIKVGFLYHFQLWPRPEDVLFLSWFSHLCLILYLHLA